MSEYLFRFVDHALDRRGTSRVTADLQRDTLSDMKTFSFLCGVFGCSGDTKVAGSDLCKLHGEAYLMKGSENTS